MAFVGLDASDITVFVSRVARSHFFHYPCKGWSILCWFLSSANSSKTDFVLFVFRLSIVQGFKGFCWGIKGCSKSLSALAFTPTWGYNAKCKENIVWEECLIFGTVQKHYKAGNAIVCKNIWQELQKTWNLYCNTERI